MKTNKNELNILIMLHEFRNWNIDQDNYMSKNHKSVDEFVKLLSKKFKVIRNEKNNNNN